MKKQEEKKPREFILECPKCKSTFDVAGQMNIWRNEFLKYLDKAIEEMNK